MVVGWFVVVLVEGEGVLVLPGLVLWRVWVAEVL